MVLMAAYFLEIRDAMESLKIKKEKCHKLNLQIQKANEYLANKELIEHQYQLAGERLKNKFSIQQDLYSVLSHLFMLARLSGLTILSVRPEGEIISCSAIGELAQFDAFFYALMQLQMPLLLKDFDLLRQNDHDWKIFMSLKALLTKPDKKIFVPAKMLSSTEFLTLFPLNKLQFAGYLAEGKRHWGLIKMPNDKTLSVQIGEVIAQEHYKIIAINEHKIQLQSPQNTSAILESKS